MKPLLVLLISAASCVASPIPDFPFLFVMGEGVESGATEKAEISITIDIESAESEAGQLLYQKANQNLRSLLRQSEITENAIQFNSLTKAKINRSQNAKNDEPFFRFHQEITVQIVDFEKYPDLVAKLANSSDVARISTEFIPQDEKRVKEGSRKKAFQDALSRAELLAKAADVKIEGVHSVSERPFADLDSLLPSYGFSSSVSGVSVETAYTVPETVNRYSEVFMLFRLAEKE